ncbi:FeoC-like transcriptional regulator [Legionella waltersii]|uniref:FeoC like transcriptional regulator n=1 Tax=Legionella waltersii TaxID=66969 RepID=A0A0W1AD95_9GAMM|nr:FeoC-like transcriptional regulator [Legionella waltersii]KTD79256.1 FeoC like transcriptional regulator [Legionella waltersii]SNV12745.1 FeoC like transcriptional regulator [Legionella waltersii]
MLLQIRDYIRQQGIVSTQQLAREFRLDIAALKPMLQLWVKKGVIQKCQEKAGCNSACFKCRVPPEYYQFSS